MKESKFLPQLVFFSCFFSWALSAEEHLRFLLSAGALVNQNEHAFYESPIFRGEGQPPFTIVGAPRVYLRGTTIIYSPDEVSKDEILAAVFKKTEENRGFSAASFRGFSVTRSPDQGLIEYLSAKATTFHSETRTVGEKNVYGYFFGPERQWPKAGDSVKEMPAVLVHDARGAETLVVARSMGDLSHRLGLVDHLLKKGSPGSTFIELGAHQEAAQLIHKENLNAVIKRQPTGLFLGTVEMASLIANPNYLAGLPTIYPFGESYRKEAKVNGVNLNLWSAAFYEKVWPIYAHLGKQAMLAMEISKMSENRAVFNAVKVFSFDAAIKASSCADVDLVLLASKNPYAELPMRESIDLGNKVAPIIRVAESDITEVVIAKRTSQGLSRVDIIRHAITDDGPRANDVIQEVSSYAPGLPDINELFGTSDKTWSHTDLERLLGGMLCAHTKADLAIFETLPISTPIRGSIPMAMAESLLSPPGNIAVFTMTGKLLKKTFSLIKEKLFEHEFFVYGVDSKAATRGDRPIVDGERYSVALTEQALLSLYGIARVGGFSQEFPIRAPFVESIYGDINSFYFIGGIKQIQSNAVKAEMAQMLSELTLAESAREIVRHGLKNQSYESMRKYIRSEVGESHGVLTFDLAYLDLGLSKNVTNSLYDKYAEGRILPTGRGVVKRWAHVFIYAKAALNYDTSFLQTSLGGEIKYLHTNLNDKPEKDKIKLTLKFRLPWERNIAKGSSIVAAPIFKASYDTKLAPHVFSHHEKISPRPHRLESLLGFNFDFTKLRFNVDLGGVVAADLMRPRVIDAIDLGPGLNFFSKWPLFGPVELSSEIRSAYLFPLAKNLGKDKIAFSVEGTLWLRFMLISDFSVAAISDFLVATMQEAPKDFAVSSIFGITISYGRLFRLFG